MTFRPLALRQCSEKSLGRNFKIKTVMSDDVPLTHIEWYSPRKLQVLYIHRIYTFFCIPPPLLSIQSKLLRIVKTCLDGIQINVRIGNYLSYSFSIENGLKLIDTLLPLLFKFALGYAIRKAQDIYLGLDMKDIHKILAYAGDVS